MRKFILAGICISGCALADGPYPAVSGISAAADDAMVAATNPAAMTLFDDRQNRFEVLGFFSESTWEGRLGEDGPVNVVKDSSQTIVPVGMFVLPFREKWWFGFTVLGTGFSDEFEDDWIGRYFVQEYELLYIVAYPSIATRLTDRLSVAASLALSYTTYDQTKAVLNLDPGFGDGTLDIETDGFSAGFGLSALYEFSKRTRMGFTYQSEIEPSLDGRARFSDLGPITEEILERADVLNTRVDVSSRSPQAATLGAYHDFENGHTVTADAAWIDFSRFKLAELYVNGDQVVENEQEYDDALAFSASYSFPVAERWRLGVGGFLVNDIVGDENRTMMFRLDDIWSAGIGVQWRWREDRVVNASLNYLAMGNAPVAPPALTILGQVSGRYTDRDTFYFRVSVSLGAGRRP